ncbi:MAG: aminotransferase class IV, partial [Phycisphaerae bacterium]|nr:aminotransferase class IV [Phycisphaerae bacterium]
MREQQREWVSLNGQLMPAEEARVSVFDAGFMQGIGLFETMRTYFGRVFRLDEHIERLRGSAEALDWVVVPAAGVLVDCVDDVVAAVDAADVRVRLTVTSGTLHEQSQPALTIVASAAAGVKYPPEMYERGVTVTLCDYRHNRFDPTAGHKTTSYFARLAALREAHQKQAVETLWFTHDQRLAEGSISNVFIVHDQKLMTPPMGMPVLPGVTRGAVLELARKL